MNIPDGAAVGDICVSKNRLMKRLVYQRSSGFSSPLALSDFSPCPAFSSE